MKKTEYAALMKPLIVELEDKREEIVSKWANTERLKKTLAVHNIYPSFFKKHFAYKMFDNLLSVLRAERNAGQCPIIHVLQHFSSDKNIPVHDIFYICSDLKNTLSYFYMHYFYGKVPVEVFWELTKIMDQNFIGVMKEYSTPYVEADQKKVEVFQPDKIQKENVSFNDLEQQKAYYSAPSERLQDIRFSKEERYGSDVLFEMVDTSIVDKIDQFTEDLDELLLFLYDIEEHHPLESRELMQNGVVPILERFYALVDVMVVFPVMASTFKNLALFLDQLSVDFYENEEQKHLLVQNLIGLTKDLEQWINIIFIKRIADDVHYLDASFANNVLEIESICNRQQIATDEEDDLEFF